MRAGNSLQLIKRRGRERWKISPKEECKDRGNDGKMEGVCLEKIDIDPMRAAGVELRKDKLQTNKVKGKGMCRCMRGMWFVFLEYKTCKSLDSF